MIYSTRPIPAINSRCHSGIIAAIAGGSVPQSLLDFNAEAVN